MKYQCNCGILGNKQYLQSHNTVNLDWFHRTIVESTYWKGGVRVGYVSMRLLNLQLSPLFFLFLNNECWFLNKIKINFKHEYSYFALNFQKFPWNNLFNLKLLCFQNRSLQCWSNYKRNSKTAVFLRYHKWTLNLQKNSSLAKLQFLFFPKLCQCLHILLPTCFQWTLKPTKIPWNPW